MKNQLIRSRGFRAAVFFSLLTLAVTFVMLNCNLLSNVQAQQSAANQTTDILDRIEGIKQPTNKKTFRREAQKQRVATTAKNIEPLAQAASGDCGWTSAAEYPIPIATQAVATVGSNLYSFGGATIDFEQVANSYKFDGTMWTPIAPLPGALKNLSAASDGTYIYISGGVDSVAVYSTLYRYDPATDTYTTLAPAPTATFSAAVTYLNGKIYKIGGVTLLNQEFIVIPAVEVYDVAGNTWTTAADYPGGPVAFHSAFAVSNYLYTAGGIISGEGGPTAKTYRYDPATNTWDDAAIADLPAARYAAGAASYNAGAVVAGGSLAGFDTGITSAILWVASVNRWVALPNQLAPRYFSAAGVLGDYFYNIGGRLDADDTGGTTDNQRLCPPVPAPIVEGSITYISENGTPANNTPDPGETVTVNLNLQNFGPAPTGNTTVTLQATGGIVPVTTTQSYGVLAVGGAAVSRNFTFTVPANAVCGSQVTLTFTVSDGTTTTTIIKTYLLGVLQSVFSQNFDGVTTPGLPAGWTRAQTGSNTGWVTTTISPDSAPNSAFAPVDQETPGGADLTSPPINITTSSAILNFRLKYDTEEPYDGGILEIKIGAEAFQDIIAAGGVFTEGGYNNRATGNNSPFPFLTPVWSGNSNGYINVSVNLPAAANGQAVQFKWRVGSDDIFGQPDGGINIDNVVVLGSSQCATISGGVVESRADFNADGKTDVSVFRNGTWFVQQSGGPFVSVQFGAAGDQIVPGDYDADNKTDYAVFRPGSPANFYVLNSANSTVSFVSWGGTGDIPLTGDFTGDGRSDFTVYRPSNNTWYTYSLAGGTVAVASIGTAGQTPVTLDYDGDGTTDRALWNSSNGVWTLRRSSDASVVAVQFGATGDKLVPADYDGDNKEDLAVYRGGQWIALLSGTNAAVFINFGAPSDVPVPGDYDGDGKDDQAVYRDGVWYINASTSGFSGVSFGAPTDKPVPAGYLSQ